MGNCNKIVAQPAKVNPDDQIGTVLTVPGACAPAGTGAGWIAGLIPQNGEYEWAGEGSSCFYCSNGAPNSISCSVGCDGVDCCAIVGHTGTYKRTSYKADPVQCCITGQPMIGELTCNPDYRNPNSSACYDIVKTYCILGERLFSDKVCQSWCSNNHNECNLYKSKICNDPVNINNAYCKSWCLQNPGLCDTSAADYCKNNNPDKFCNCLNSDLIKYKYNPLCEDKSCIDFGYPTSSMVTSRGQGCQIIDCNTYFNVVSEGKVQLTDVDVAQRCGSTQSSQQTLSQSFWERNKTLIIYIIAWVLLILLIILLIVVIGKKR
jgi:hypothetical protein